MTGLPLSLPLPQALEEALAKFDRWSDDQLRRLQADNLITEPLYHYTNAAGLDGIIKTQKMWLTDYRLLNDTSEIRFGMEAARAILNEQQQGEDGRINMFCKVIDDLFSLDNVDANLAFFVGSFSRDRDELGQWRAYADNGRGFAIGFAPKMFGVRQDLSDALDQNAFLSPITYGSERALSKHRRVIVVAAQFFRDAANANAELMRSREVGLPFMREFALHLIASQLIWNCLRNL